MGACTALTNKLALITAFCENGSLYRHLHTLKTVFPLTTIVHFCEQISQGMSYLHARGMIHRDLKSKSKQERKSEF